MIKTLIFAHINIFINFFGVQSLRDQENKVLSDSFATALFRNILIIIVIYVVYKLIKTKFNKK